MTVIIGIDPGLQRTGWGIISSEANQLSFVACGTIITDNSLSMPERILQLHDGLKAAIFRYHPTEAAIEETFVNVNGATTLKLGQARGGLLLTLSINKLSVYEYSATMVKKSVVGSGHAGKNQIGTMVKTLLPASAAKGPIQPDAADALAIAICHAHQRTLKATIADAERRALKKGK